MLAEELGYEDVDEFEDALGGSFQDFVAGIPHITVRERDDVRGGEENPEASV